MTSPKILSYSNTPIKDLTNIKTGKNIKKILLAEDDDDDFNMFYTAIVSLYRSVDILRTENGIMLSSLLETSIKPDIIFLDINLPFKNGLLCLKEIKNNPDLRDVQVIMYSTSNSVKDVNTCYDLGADFFLVKQSSYPGIVRQLSDLFQHSLLAGTPRTKAEFVLNAGSSFNN